MAFQLSCGSLTFRGILVKKKNPEKSLFYIINFLSNISEVVNILTLQDIKK